MFNTKKHHSISSSCLPMQEKVHSPSTSSTCVGSRRTAPFSHHSQIAALPAWDTVCTEMQTPCLCSTILELFFKIQEAGNHYFSVCFPEENAVQNGGSCEVVLQVWWASPAHFSFPLTYRETQRSWAILTFFSWVIFVCPKAVLEDTLLLQHKADTDSTVIAEESPPPQQLQIFTQILVWK